MKLILTTQEKIGSGSREKEEGRAPAGRIRRRLVLGGGRRWRCRPLAAVCSGVPSGVRFRPLVVVGLHLTAGRRSTEVGASPSSQVTGGPSPPEVAGTARRWPE